MIMTAKPSKISVFVISEAISYPLNNTWVTNIDSDNVTFNVDVNGDNGSIDYDADGFAVNSTGHTFILDQDGDYVDYTIDQQSTSAVDYLYR